MHRLSEQHYPLRAAPTTGLHHDGSTNWNLRLDELESAPDELESAPRRRLGYAAEGYAADGALLPDDLFLHADGDLVSAPRRRRSKYDEGGSRGAEAVVRRTSSSPGHVDVRKLLYDEEHKVESARVGSFASHIWGR